MLIAPHPDDETLACGVLLQRIARAGGAVRVLYVTDGANNPWPQRALERKWRLGERDRRRWGRLRRQEATAALRVLGLKRDDAKFLHWPDQGLTELLTRECDRCVDVLRREIASWQPTLLLVPAITDTHADHNARGAMLRFVQHDLHSQLPTLPAWSYTVHGRSAAFLRDAAPLRPASGETAMKLTAINCHKTQLLLSRRRFTAYARRPERFCDVSCRGARAGGPPVVSLRNGTSAITLQLRLPFRPFQQETHLFLVGCDAESLRPMCLRAKLRARSSDVVVVDSSTRDAMGTFVYRGDPFVGELLIPTSIFSSTRPFFVKINRGPLAGSSMWVEVNYLSRHMSDKPRLRAEAPHRACDSLSVKHG